MVKYITLVIYGITMVYHALSAQQGTSSVFGIVADSSSNQPLPFVTVVIKTSTDSAFLQSAATDEAGHFMLKGIHQGSYFIEASFLGFNSKPSPVFEINAAADQINLGTLFLTGSDQWLKEIEVVASNPAFVNDIDRKIYYPGNDIQAQSGSVTDILQNIPSITVGAEGEISLRGSENIQYLLNGKTSSLLKTNSTSILEQIPAHTIERIEIITNPSAKYKPDGVAGIINIVTKKNILPGFHGSVLANASTQQRYNGNISLNYNPGKFNISGLYSYWQNYSPRTITDFRIVQDSFSAEETTFDLKNATLSKPMSHTATLSMDYQPDDKNTFGLSGSYFNLNADRTADVSTLETNTMGTVNDYTTLRTQGDAETEFDFSGKAEHSFKKEDHTLSFEAGYSSADEIEDSRFTDVYHYPAYPMYDGHTRLDKKENTTTLSLDYSNPLSEDLEFEAGFEGEYSSGDLDYYSEYFDNSELVWKNDTAKSNRFLYDQHIQAVYATLSKQMEAFGILAGLRAEQTNIESNLVDYDSIIPNNYFNLFPTLHLSYELGEDQDIGLSYSRRVNRPDPDELNPFPEYTNIRDIETGNPLLKPEQIHSIELGYHYDHDPISFLPTLYYRQTYDGFSDETYYINDSTLYTTIVNVEKKSSGGLELVFSWTPVKKINLNLNSNIFYQTIDASNLGYEGDKSMVSADTKLAAFYNIFSGTKLQLNTTYRSAMLTAQGKNLPVFFINAGVRQDLFHRKASVTLTFSDIFNTMRWRTIIDTPLLYQEETRKRKSQVVYLGFSYRFGMSLKKPGDELIFDDKL